MGMATVSNNMRVSNKMAAKVKNSRAYFSANFSIWLNNKIFCLKNAWVYDECVLFESSLLMS